jgi:G3E family GTPase
VTRAHVITGSFGAGKTTAIRTLMSGKPPDELWIVVLNEFTDAGIDAITVAQAARGQYDVRMVAGGCLCCVGELEFTRQLHDILKVQRPTRILIEPSGAGHAADIVDALGGYAAQGALSLDSVVCLVDALDAVRIDATHPVTEWSQIQAADVLLLSKPDLAGEAQRQAFTDICAVQFPTKAFIGECLNGALPPAALQAFERPTAFSLLEPPQQPATPVTLPFDVLGLPGSETQLQQLGLWGIQWRLPGELTFARSIVEPRVQWLNQAYGNWLRRMKAVLRTGPGPSWLLQSHSTMGGQQLSSEYTGYRRDSRLELVLGSAPTEALLDEWRRMLRDAANAPRR